ncbi:site-specific integrase [Mesorhizobium sp. KR1-2]|uniref:site-specific integrase n=1 Tax=Mesorhizobium sp. KR1-2 TaxID=3156609 RepID=UPI0032B4A6B4
MTVVDSHQQPSHILPAIPETSTTRDGFVYRPRDDEWRIASLLTKMNFKFSNLDGFSDRIIHRLKLVFIWYLENRSFAHARNVYLCLQAFRRQLDPSEDACFEIDLGRILSYRASLDDTTEWKLGVLRILLEDMEKLSFGIATSEALEYLRDATIRGNIKGTSVRTRDPEKGAFNDTELLAIQAALNNSFARGEIDLYHFALTWLFLGYGPRPIQIAAIKERDLIISEGDEGRFYALRMPRAKQRSEDVRASFKVRYCSKQIGQLLEEVIRLNQRRREQLGLDGDDWPMFMSRKEGHLPGLRHHMNANTIGHMLNQVVGRITGMKTNSRRFRITLAQRAVDDGKDKYTVAELLDHSDTQNVGVYYEASPSIVLRLDRHLAMELAPLAQAFAGVVVQTEAEAQRGGDRSSRIYDRSLVDNVADPLGTCGQMSFCGLAVPFACYTCRHFQPWLDGPHEEFMAALIADRERMAAENYSPKIYSIRDRIILAVAEVIQLCAAERDQMELDVA